MNDERKGATSASNALADSLCPGRHLAQAGLPDKEGEYAAHGRLIHQVLADSANPMVVNSLNFEQRETFDACRELEQRLANQFFGLKYPPMRVFREERYWVKVPGPAGRSYEHSGKPDVVFKAGVKALVLEYKTLPGDVPGSPRNLQLRDQAVLVRGFLSPTEEVAVAVIQPMVTRSPEICLYSKADLNRAEEEMFKRVIASNDPVSARVPGEAQCQFCRAKRQCVEYQKWASQMTPPAMLTIMDVPVANWTPEQRTIAATALGPAKKFLADLEDFFKDGLRDDPDFVPGFELKPGNLREIIKDPQAAFERFTKLGGDTAAFMAAVTVGKGKLEQALHEASGLKGIALKNALKAMLDGITETTINAPSLKKSGGDK